MKKALITGITGQDGSYLAELLIEKGYEIYGLVRRLSVPNYSNISRIVDRINVIEGDLIDLSSLNTAVKEIQPDEIYNLAAQSFVGTSWTQPIQTAQVTGLGVLNILDAVKQHAPEAKFYQASSSEMFGKVQETPQNEKTPFYPRSPYGIAKLFGYWMTVNYRESYNMFACSGINFNHESERRGAEFVTQKIALGVAKIALGSKAKIKLGSIDAKRDWGYSPDYCEAMYKILQYKEPTDFVIATNEQHSVRDFIKEAFSVIDVESYDKYIEIDPKLYRPADVNNLIGDYSKAKKLLGWKPKTVFKELVEIMVKSAIEQLPAI